jgi:hypothetical protein
MSEWQQTHDINMTIQSMELSLSGFDMNQKLVASCNLVNIARGQSVVTIIPDRQLTQIKGIVIIRMDKRVMQVEIAMPDQRFADILNHLKQPPLRPLGMVLTVDEALAVSLEGDLQINEEMTLNLTDVNLTIPIR